MASKKVAFVIKTILVPIRIDIEKLDYQKVVSIDLKSVAISDWCVSLCLLKEGLVSTLEFVGNSKLIVQIDSSLQRSTRARVVASPDSIRLVFHPDEFDFLLSFFLKYYRDGVAEVDHIDIEGLAYSRESEEAEESYITFQMKDYQPQMSAEEMQRVLDKTE